VNLLPYLNGRPGAPHEALYWRAGNGHAMRKGKWKLVEFSPNQSKLYDLEADPGETTDLSARQAGVHQSMRGEWKAWSDTMAPAAWPARFRELTTNGVKTNWEL
jgi:arylsulfatase A-like enzyme